MTKADAFLAGWNFRWAVRECWDSRDVSRVLGADYFPPEIRELAPRLNGFRGKDAGIKEAFDLIRQLLNSDEPAASPSPKGRDG